MKKIISTVLVFILVLSVSVVSAFSESIVTPDADDELLFVDKFEEQYKDYFSGFFPIENYKEKMYHYDSNDNIDWALVRFMFMEGARNEYAVFGDMVYLGSCGAPLVTGYAIYDAKQQKFFDLIEFDDFSQFDGLDDYLCSVKRIRPIGDINKDFKLTVLDATGIQRALAKLDVYPDFDDLQANSFWNARNDNELKYVTDANRDGVRSILDATAIQRKLAKLD